MYKNAHVKHVVDNGRADSKAAHQAQIHWMLLVSLNHSVTIESIIRLHYGKVQNGTLHLCPLKDKVAKGHWKGFESLEGGEKCACCSNHFRRDSPALVH